jgi:hypothetical protein
VASDAASWLAAVGTIGAVFAVLWLARIDARRRSREERRRQAELITAWVGEENLERSVPLGDARERLDPSGLPRGHFDRLCGRWSRVVRPANLIRRPGEGSSRSCRLVRNEPLSVEWNVGDWTARPGVEIAFQDAAGRAWVREWNGKLSEVEKTDHLKRLGLEEPLGWDSEGPA